MPAERPIAFGPYRLDDRRGLLLRDGEPVHIRAKTFALLTEFARHPDKVLGKDELMAAIWPGLVVTEDSLTQTIRDLRKALGEEAERIRTIPRRGYLFDLSVQVQTHSAQDEMPLVAVFPFAAEAGVDQSLADGLAEETTHGLGRYGLLRVIAWHSAFRLRPEAGAAVEAARQLGATHCVGGTARGQGENIRLSITLCETESGRQIWGETFELTPGTLRQMAGIIPHQIAQRLTVDIERQPQMRTGSGLSNDPGAYRLFLSAVALLRQYGDGVNERGRDLLIQALQRDPDFALAHAYLGLAAVIIGRYGAASVDVLETARSHAQKGVDLAPEEARCHWILSLIRLFQRAFDSSELHITRALALNPTDPDFLACDGYLATMRGRFEEGLAKLKEAARLNPMHPTWYHQDTALALQGIGEYAQAIGHLQMLPRQTAFGEVQLAACHAALGERKAALHHLARADQFEPGWTAMEEAKRVEYEREQDRARFIAEVEAALALREGPGP